MRWRRSSRLVALALLSAAACSPAPAPPSRPIAASPVPTPSTAAAPTATAATQAPTPTTPAQPSPSPAEAPVVAVLPYRLPGALPNADDAIYAIDSLWIPFFASPHGWLLRLDAGTGRVQARYPIGESPNSMAMTDPGTFWVANDIGDGSRRYAGANTLTRLDLRTGRLTSTGVQVGGPIAAGFGSVFVPAFENGTGNARLAKVDAATGRVTARWPISGRPVVGCGRLWVVRALVGLESPNVTVLTMVDPASGRRLGEFPLIADGIDGPATVDGACRLLSVSDNPWQQALQPVSVDDGSAAPATAVFRDHTYILDGGLWSRPADGGYQPVAPDGSPAGPAIALPAAATADGADPYFFVAGGVGWAVGNAAAYRLALR